MFFMISTPICTYELPSALADGLYLRKYQALAKQTKLKSILFALAKDQRKNSFF